MNLTIHHQHHHRQVGHTAAAEVIAAALRAGHTVSLTGPDGTRHTFTLDHDRVTVTSAHLDGADREPPAWATRLAAAAARRI